MKNNFGWILIGALVVASTAVAQDAGEARPDRIPSSLMTFFVTSEPIGDGGNLGGLAGADAHCQKLAAAAGAGGKTWRAYLSTQARPGQPAVNARDRIGKGPWYSAKERVPDYLKRRLSRPIIQSEIHGDTLDEARRGSNLTKEFALTEKGELVNGIGDPLADPPRHPDRLAAGWTRVYRRGRSHLQQLDEQRRGLRAGRPFRSRRQREPVVELVARDERLQPAGSRQLGRRRVVLLLRRELEECVSIVRSVRLEPDSPPRRAAHGFHARLQVHELGDRLRRLSTACPTSRRCAARPGCRGRRSCCAISSITTRNGRSRSRRAACSSASSTRAREAGFTVMGGSEIELYVFDDTFAERAGEELPRPAADGDATSRTTTSSRARRRRS